MAEGIFECDLSFKASQKIMDIKMEIAEHIMEHYNKFISPY